MTQKSLLRSISSPLSDRRLIDTFSAARILFPQAEKITKAKLRLVQRLCQRNELDCWQIGRRYFIDLDGFLRFIETNHHRSARGALD